MTHEKSKKLRILCCDDENYFREDFEGLCKELNISCKTVKTFSETLKEAHTYHYDFFVLDVSNDIEPHIDSCDIAYKLRELQPSAELIVTSCANSYLGHKEGKYFDQRIGKLHLFDYFKERFKDKK